MAGDDLFEGVKEKVLASGVSLDLRQYKWEIPLQVSSTDTAYMDIT